MNLPRQKPVFWTGPRLVGAPLVLALLLVLLRFGPAYLQRLQNGSTTPDTQRTSDSGAWRPLAPVENLVARGLSMFLVDKPPPGEDLTPTIRYEQAWPEWLFLLVLLSGAGLIIWLYRREGSTPFWPRVLLTGLRLALFLMAIFFLAEATLSVQRTGLPVFAVLIDDSASGQIVDPYPEPETQARALALAKISGREKPDRLAVGLGWLLADDSRLLKSLVAQQRNKFYRVSDAAKPVAEVLKPDDLPGAIQKLREIQPNGNQSRLGDDLKQVLEELRGSPPTAVLLLTDGQTTDGVRLAEAAEISRKDGVELFAIGLGDERPARDLALSDLQVDEVAFVGDSVRFDARLTAKGFEPTGGGQPGTVSVTLKRKKPGSSDMETLETVRLPLSTDGKPQKVELSHRPQKPEIINYVLEIEPRERELQTENNRIDRVVEIRDQKLKVLYVEGEPRWEFRYLKTYLERDNTVDLSVVLMSSGDGYQEQDRSALPNFPAGKDGPDGLFQYDAVILGDVDPSLLNSQHMNDLVEFVTKKGGGLLFLAGELFNPLAYKGRPLEPLIPVRLDDARNPASTGVPVEPYHPALTPEGRASPIFRLADDEIASLEIWAKLPPSLWFFEASRRQPTAVVLLEHPSKQGADGKLPLLLYQYVGAGKVIFSAIDDTWRWRLRTGDRYFGRYWVQSLRFLARSKLLGQKQVEIVTDRQHYPRGQTTQVQVRFLNPSLAQDLKSLSVQLQSPDGLSRTLQLRPTPGSASASVFEASVKGLKEGKYRLQYLPPPVLPGDSPAVDFQVDPPAGEFVQIELNREELTAAANLTGGTFFRWDEQTRAVDATPSGAAGQELSSQTGVATEVSATKVEKTLAELLPPPEKVPLDSDPPIALWNTWPLFLAFLGLLTMEWLIRKRWQLA